MDATQPDGEAIEQFFAEGGTLAMLRSVPRAQLETLYTQAFGHYQAGRLDEALTLFQGLATLDHYDARAFLGMAGTRQAQGQYRDALPGYAYGALLAPEDLRFVLHAAECHQQLGDKSAARFGYEQALQLAVSAGQTRLAERVQVLLEALQGQEGTADAS